MAANPVKCHRGRLAIAYAKWHCFQIIKNQTLGIGLLVAAVLLSGCRQSSPKQLMKASETEAACDEFLQVLDSIETAGMEKIILLTKEWRRLSATVLTPTSLDSLTDSPHCYEGHTAFEDSVRSQMARLIYSRERSLEDYLHVVRELNEVEMDSLSRELAVSIHHFYCEAGNTAIYRGEADEVIRKYKQLLETTLAHGIRTKQDAIDFLRQEDVAFRSFLYHLPVVSKGQIPLDGITQDTEWIIRSIIGLAETESPVLDKSEMVILLTVRNNRRLLQNAKACLNGMQQGLVTESGQIAAYQWMLLQPWLSLDGFAFALMDEKQVRTLEELAAKTPDVLDGLDTDNSLPEMNGMPALLIEAYILGIR